MDSPSGTFRLGILGFFNY